MARFGFIGPTYTAQSPNSDCEMTMNLYPEVNESGQGKSPSSLFCTPGLKLFSGNGGSQVRGILSINSRVFAVIDAQFGELAANGTFTFIGAVLNDGNLVSMVASAVQVLIASGGSCYVYYLKTITSGTAGTFTIVTPFAGPVDQVGYSDGFGVALVASTQQYYASQALDFTIWPALSTQDISTFADNVVSMIVDHRQVWLFGAKQSEMDYDAGTIPFPFATVPGGFLEQGCGATFATVQLNNTICFIGARNDQGGCIAWQTAGYSVSRISNHAVETAWSKYPTVADARAFAYQDQGHMFWVINFPSGNATWVYDFAVGQWHQRAFWNAQSGLFQTALPQCHAYNFGKHLVGDRASGNIYQMSIPVANGSGWDFVTDNGAPIRRVRRAPIISTENQWMYFNELTIDVEVGLGPQPPLYDGAGQPREPQLVMRYSNDSAHTWSNERQMPCGASGQYARRVVARRLGRARQGRVFEVSCTDPVPWRFIDAYYNTPEDVKPRLVKQLAEVA